MKAILTLGSNYGDREENIQKARRYLRDICKTVKASPIYESPDYLGHGTKYLNLIMEVDTPVAQEQLISQLKKIEIKLGRTNERRERGEVPIDVDLVIFENEVVKPSDYDAAYFKTGFGQLQEISELDPN